jgi:hypothetical protein
MTEEEWKAWEIQRAGQMNPAPKPSLETRLAGLELDASAQRTAILKLEREVWHLQGAFWGAVAGIVFSALGWVVLT